MDVAAETRHSLMVRHSPVGMPTRQIIMQRLCLPTMPYVVDSSKPIGLAKLFCVFDVKAKGSQGRIDEFVELSRPSRWFRQLAIPLRMS